LKVTLLSNFLATAEFLSTDVFSPATITDILDDKILASGKIFF
jgi:hypothetical protein